MQEIIIVEGKSDTNRLKQIYPNIITFETSGLGLDQQKIEYLKSIADNVELIVFTDPDGPGEIIRARLINEVVKVKHAYLPNNKALSKNKTKVGIEHAQTKDIKQALANVYQPQKTATTYSLVDLIDNNIYNSHDKRLRLCDLLHIAYGNNQKVIKQLNYLGISKKKFDAAIKEINDTSK